jgi:DNA-binding NarL/FixJ family response regulator
LELTPEYHVIFEADCYQAASEKLSDCADIDIIIIDISLPDKNGIELLKYCSEHYPHIKSIIVSMYDHNPYVSNALDAGAWGYVSKRAASDELINAINAVIKGETFLSHDVLKKLHISHTDSNKSALAELTHRELDVFPLLAKGFNAKQIAQHLDIMPKTAHVHRANILKKLAIKNQFDLLKLAVSSGIITYEELA